MCNGEVSKITFSQCANMTKFCYCLCWKKILSEQKICIVASVGQTEQWDEQFLFMFSRNYKLSRHDLYIGYDMCDLELKELVTILFTFLVPFGKIWIIFMPTILAKICCWLKKSNKLPEYFFNIFELQNYCIHYTTAVEICITYMG